MNRLLLVVLVVSLLGNGVGAFFAYKHWKLRGWFNEAQAQLSEAMTSVKSLHASVDALTGKLDEYVSARAVFLHHSVGEGILTAGGLRERMLRDLGILVKSATYGDDIGQDTDMNHWAAKFSERMQDILVFSHHPNHYNSDGTVNDVVMFKSCFPNSDVVGEGELPGDPNAAEKTVANYRATFGALKERFRGQPGRLFVYLTSPPLIPELSSPDNAARARQFNDWVKNEFAEEYRRETGLQNFVVFDLFDCLAGSDNFLRMEYRNALPSDPHPNQRGAEAAAEKFMTFFEPLWESWRARS